VRNKEVLQSVNEEGNILHTIQTRKANWIGHISRRDCLLKHVTEGQIEEKLEVTERPGRRRRRLMDEFKEIQNTVN
jgi:hypothetical protein